MARRGGFPGGMGMGGANMQQLMRQAQKLQADMEKAQEEIKALEIEASAGGGMVTVKVSGEKRITSIEIKPEVVDPDDVEMLQDLVAAAVNEAMAQLEAASEEKMSKVSGGKMPGMF